ncbi:MAG: PorT family protein, partial [Flavobacterium sp.]|nr:PorT family protein [Flavobacterium sp.]
TPESHKFWRIYTGFKFRYLIFDKSVFVTNETIKITRNSDFNQIQYGPYIAFGFNTWNLTAYYGLKPVYKSAKTATETLEMKTLNIGLMFYIL